jgi:hypothetical protein
MGGRTLFGISVSGNAARVAFTASGEAVEGLPATIPAEVYLWERGQAVRRITTATGGRTASHLARLSDNGQAVAFLSQSDLAPGAPGNADNSTELFVWRDGPPRFEQVTASTRRPNVIAVDPELGPGVDAVAEAAAFVAERADDLYPLALSSRRGLLVRASIGDPYPAPGSETATPGATMSSVPPTTQPVPSPTAPVTPSQPPPPTFVPTPTLTPVPTSTPRPGPQPSGVCPQMTTRIPAAVQAAALSNPEQFEGWGRRANPNLPPGPYNPLRLWLSLRNPGTPFGPYNGAVWKAGCP